MAITKCLITGFSVGGGGAAMPSWWRVRLTIEEMKYYYFTRNTSSVSFGSRDYDLKQVRPT